MISRKILVIHPLTHSTKIAVFNNANLIFLNNIKHTGQELAKFKKVADQTEYRAKLVLRELRDDDIDFNLIEAVVARGGLMKPVKSGVYAINDIMIADLRSGVMGEHAANLGGLVAHEVAKEFPNAKAYIADPVVVDELDDIARASGHPEFERKSVFHALNHKVVGRTHANSNNQKYEDLNLIIVHVGSGGVSIAAHRKGRVVDVNQAFDGCGPFALERSGSLPSGDLVRACFSGKYTQDELISMITAEGGLKAYLGTKNLHEIERRIHKGDDDARFYLDAMAYQFAKEIGGLYTVFEGIPDGIIMIGDIFQSEIFTGMLTKRIEKLGKIVIYPGVNDLDALAMNGNMILNGEIPVFEYK
ncbi:MAG: butyrate kinase [Bacteroidetes bacterium]|nr:butyrate kinase [Bacteroidota bacterium]MBU1718925.1 butyrate kinase [Bacteroidota bacterium]